MPGHAFGHIEKFGKSRLTGETGISGQSYLVYNKLFIENQGKNMLDKESNDCKLVRCRILSFIQFQSTTQSDLEE